MRLLRLALLLLSLRPTALVAQAMSGGGFEMTGHSMGSVSQGDTAVAGGSMTFAGGSYSSVAPVYPRTSAAGWSMLKSGGSLRYRPFLTNSISQNSVTVALPSNAVPLEFDFFITDPLTTPMRASQATITQANLRLGDTLGPQAILAPQSVVEFNLLQDSGVFFDSTLAHPATISLPYKDVNNDGIVDGTNPPLRVKNLGIYVLDEVRSYWVRVPGASLNVAAHTVTGVTPHFSVYALIGVADTTVDDVHPFPVPWAPNSGNPLDGTLAGGITFTNLPTQGTISIYTLSGQLVRALPIPAFAPTLVWDVKTPSGANVVSGVYLWRVTSGSNSKVGKLMVIR